MLEVLSFGAGVQSTTLLFMSCDGVLPKLDAAIFADTQAEPQAVYAHLERCKAKAAKAGIELIVATAGNLRDDLVEFWGKRKSADGKRHASIPAFIKNPGESVPAPLFGENEVIVLDETRGIVRRQCTETYKIEVVERCVRKLLGLKKGQRWPVVPSVRLWLGISADEMDRMRVSSRPAVVHWYPLVEHLTVPANDLLGSRAMTRSDCLAWMESRGYERPPRSACTFCPFRSDAGWAQMKHESPDDFADACRVDRDIRQQDRSRTNRHGGIVGEPYIHSSLIPLDMVDFSAETSKYLGGMRNECMGMCGN